MDMEPLPGTGTTEVLLGSNLSTIYNDVLLDSQYSLFFNLYNLKSLFQFHVNFDSNDLHFTSTGETDEDSLVQLTYLIQGIGISFVATLGIIGNILNITVLSTKRMRTSISCLLIGLAICDIFLLVDALALFGLPTLVAYSQNCSTNDSTAAETFIKFGRFVPFFYGLGVTTLTAEVYFIIAVTLERYLVVCRPFIARRICTWNRAGQVSVFIVLMSLMYNSPRWFEYTCTPVYDNQDATVISGCFPVTRQFVKDELYLYWYAHILFFIVHLICPIACLVGFNALIFLKIQESNAARRKLTFYDPKENSLAKMLLVVVAVFIGCNSLYPIHAILKLVTQYELKYLEVFRLFFLVLNSSINFLIYCAYGDRFREVCIDSLKCMCKTRCEIRKLNESEGKLFGDSSHRSPEMSALVATDHHAELSIRSLQENA